MAVENIWYWVVPGFYALNVSSPSTWTVDIDIPAQTVYASAALTKHSGGSTPEVAFCGVVLYFSRDKNGVIHIHFPSSTDNGVTPAILDKNVVLVSFGYGAQEAIASCNFVIMGAG
jgi:hypothetical protein